jgi:hypothetical protein
MYIFLDHLLWLAHVVVIVFNLTGWIWRKTRKLHLLVFLATLLSWLVLGLRYGLGYCFLTDWHWQVKQIIGEKNLPSSFIKYFLDSALGTDLNPGFVDWITGISMAIAAICTTVVWMRKQ